MAYKCTVSEKELIDKVGALMERATETLEDISASTIDAKRGMRTLCGKIAELPVEVYIPKKKKTPPPELSTKPLVKE